MSGDDTPPTPSRPSLHSSAAGPAASNGNARGAGPAGLSVLASIGPGLQSSGRRTARLWWGSALLLGLAGGAGLWLASSQRAVEAEVEARMVAPLPAPAVAVAAPLSVATPASAPGPSPAAAAAAQIENVNGPASAVATPASAPFPAAAKAVQETPNVRTASSHKTPHQSPQRTAHQTAPKAGAAGTLRAATAGPGRGEPASAMSTAAFGPKRDTDVDLLEAMMVHDARPARAVPPSKAPRTASPALSRQIERCNAPSVADPVACLAKACAGRGPEDARCAAPARAP